MAYGLQPASFVIALFALFQFGIAWLLLRKRERSSTRLLSGLLLLANGLVSIGVAAQFLEPSPDWAIPFIVTFDAPTGLLLGLLAVAFYYEAKPDSGRIRGRFIPLAVAFASAVLLATPFIWMNEAVFRNRIYGFYSQVPLWLGLGLLCVVAYSKLRRAVDKEETTFYTLVLAGYGSRAAQFLPQHVVGNAIKIRDEMLLSGNISLIVDGLARIVFAVVMTTVFVLLVRQLARGKSGQRRRFVLVGCALGGALGLGFFLAPGLDASFLAIYTLDILTLVLVRPLLVGLAFERTLVLRTSGLVMSAFGVFVVSKAVLSALFDRSFLQLTELDLAAAALVLVLSPAIITLPRPSGAHEGPGALWPKVGEPTHAARLALYLAQMQGGHQPEAGLTQREIEQGVGIRPSNISAELKRMERLLSRHLIAEDQGKSVLVVQTRGVRGRKFYRLTEAGIRATQALPAASKFDV